MGPFGLYFDLLSLDLFTRTLLKCLISKLPIIILFNIKFNDMRYLILIITTFNHILIEVCAIRRYHRPHRAT